MTEPCHRFRTAIVRCPVLSRNETLTCPILVLSLHTVGTISYSQNDEFCKQRGTSLSASPSLSEWSPAPLPRRTSVSRVIGPSVGAFSEVPIGERVAVLTAVGVRVDDLFVALGTVPPDDFAVLVEDVPTRRHIVSLGSGCPGRSRRPSGTTRSTSTPVRAPSSAPGPYLSGPGAAATSLGPAARGPTAGRRPSADDSTDDD